MEVTQVTEVTQVREVTRVREVTWVREVTRVRKVRKVMILLSGAVESNLYPVPTYPFPPPISCPQPKSIHKIEGCYKLRRRELRE
jgi:hypothetical protein